MKYRALKSLALILFLVALAEAQNLASFEKRITVKKLNNGLTVVLCERPEAPVFAFFTHVDAGSVQDPLGKTGLAHMFEHMAFKGTDKIGTTDYAAEKVALEKVEKAYAAYTEERDKSVGRNEQKLQELHKAWQDAVAEAQKYVKPNEFPQILESNGAEGLNAFTSEDETAYHYSLPENRLELWAYLESERFMHPVMREFYKERNVVIEERRMRTDSNPIGRLLEQFTTAAFQAHPYHRPTIGWMSDLNSFSATDARKFFDEYYIPSNMVVAVVGDVKATEALPVIEKYFGRIRSHARPDERTTTEPPQNSERRVVLHEMAQPLYLEGYHRPDYRGKDEAVYDAIDDLMSNGRTSIHVEIERLKKEDISDEELKMIKTRAKASLLRGLANNEGLAFQLALFQARFDDWRQLFRQVDNIDKVSKTDIRRIANQTFVLTNRTVGIIETAAPAASGQKEGTQ